MIDDEDLGKVARFKWSSSFNGRSMYVTRQLSGGHKKLYLHRIIMEARDGEIVDHVDGNGLDNRKMNLRKCSKAENNRNRMEKVGPKTSKYKGVCRNKRNGKFIAQIGCEGKHYFLGHFASEFDAAMAYNKAAQEYFGEFARLNELHAPKAQTA